jgi:hypothetical protein
MVTPQKDRISALKGQTTTPRSQDLRGPGPKGHGPLGQFEGRLIPSSRVLGPPSRENASDAPLDRHGYRC